MSLNGQREFEFDDSNVGVDEGRAPSGRKSGRTTLVPFCFESRRGGIRDTSFHPHVWHRRSLLKAGSNVLTVRVEDLPTDRFIPWGKQYGEPKSAAIFYTKTSRIWQTVWLESVGDSYFDRVRITPSLDGTVRFDALVARAKPDLEFRAAVKFGEMVEGHATGSVAGPRSTAVVVIPGPRLWFLGRPNLYGVTFELRRGSTVLDRVNSYFGFRSISAANGNTCVSGRSVFLKMALD